MADSVRDQDPARAVELYTIAADSGDAIAASSLGYMLMVGEGVRENKVKAEHYLRIASDAGNPKAMCNLGNLIMDDSPEEALALFERAGEQGHITGMRDAATMYRLGAGIPTDMSRAVEWFERAAKSDITSMSVLAHILRTGEGVPVDSVHAAELYLRAAEMGDADSQYQIALMMDSGDGIPMDRAGAEKWFAAAAEQGDNDARLCLGGIYYERRDFQLAENVFMDAALAGDVKAMYNLALLYLEGSLGEADLEKAEEWMEAASDEGFAFAQSMLASFKMDAGDVDAATELFKKAAAQYEPTAMYNLGALALSGQIKMDDKEAIRYIMSAAEGGMPEAQELLLKLSGQGMI